jgi:WhiB family redox-sensing transcriptional regulator
MRESSTTTETTEPTDWRSLGACRQEDPELFFPVAQAGPGLVQLNKARAICARCEVRAECLSFGAGDRTGPRRMGRQERG